MLENRKKKRRFINNEIHTIIATLLCGLVFLTSILYVYTKTEEEAFEYLHMQTQQIKENLSLQINSDRENLITLASTVAQLYENGEDVNLIFDSFSPIGLIESIGILYPDNTLVTKYGVSSTEHELSFDEEVKKGEYVSGRVEDVTYGGRAVVRSAVPVVSGDETIAVLYGIMSVGALNNKYKKMVEDIDAQLYVYSEENGDFIIDSIHSTPGKISNLETYKYKRGFSYKQLISEEKGFSAFESKLQNKMLYVHYAKLGISDWKIMMARPQEMVFKNARDIVGNLIISFLVMLGIIVLYIGMLFRISTKKNEVISTTSEIRKLLIDINHNSDNVILALKKIVDLTNSRSGFFVDTDGEDFVYISPEQQKELICGKNRMYFTAETLEIINKINSPGATDVIVLSVCANDYLKEINPRFYDFLISNGIKEYIVASVTDNSHRVSVAGVINPKRVGTARTVLSDIAVCFAMAIYNKRYLDKTETTAYTDSLTGLYNRLVYDNDVSRYDEEKPVRFACVYVDVNGLHELNNTQGHEAGDEMLIYIANVLKDVFYGSRIYRIGGDEFLIFTENASRESVKTSVGKMRDLLAKRQYSVAVGAEYTEKNTNTSKLIRSAEVKMYREKTKYYQNSYSSNAPSPDDRGYEYITTGIEEIDALIPLIKSHYGGVYSVSLENDEVRRILSPLCKDNAESGNGFNKIFTKYVSEFVSPEYHRALMSFLNYDAIKKQLSDGSIPYITYKKTNGEEMALKVHLINNENKSDTLWVFEKI